MVFLDLSDAIRQVFLVFNYFDILQKYIILGVKILIVSLLQFFLNYLKVRKLKF